MSNSARREHDLAELAQAGRDAFYRYTNCAQASFAVLQEEFNLDHAVILKALGLVPGDSSKREAVPLSDLSWALACIPGFVRTNRTLTTESIE